MDLNYIQLSAMRLQLSTMHNCIFVSGSRLDVLQTENEIEFCARQMDQNTLM